MLKCNVKTFIYEQPTFFLTRPKNAAPVFYTFKTAYQLTAGKAFNGIYRPFEAYTTIIRLWRIFPASIFIFLTSYLRTAKSSSKNFTYFIALTVLQVKQ